MANLLEICPLDVCYQRTQLEPTVLDELREKFEDWISMQPHFPPVKIRKHVLENLLMTSKLSLEVAKQKLDMYFTVRRLMPEMYANRDPRGPQMMRIYETTQVACLRNLTPDDLSRVMIMRLASADTSNFSAWGFIRYLMSVAEIRLQEDRCMSDIYIYDLANIRLGHLTEITPTLLKKFEVIGTKAYTAIINEIHLINASPMINRVVAMVKGAVKKKIADRIHVHAAGEYELLYKSVPQSMMPMDYGGDGPSMNELADQWKEKLFEYRDWFIEQETMLVDERRRPNTMMNMDDIFGFSGSFRKLDVD